MLESQDICQKINTLFPEVGEFGKDIHVNFDSEKIFWVVDLKHKNRHLKTYVDSEDVDSCLVGGKCLGLGIEIAQLKDNI